MTIRDAVQAVIDYLTLHGSIFSLSSVHEASGQFRVAVRQAAPLRMTRIFEITPDDEIADCYNVREVEAA